VRQLAVIHRRSPEKATPGERLFRHLIRLLANEHSNPIHFRAEGVTGSAVNIVLRAACANDADFARDLYFETMRGIIERLFGWDQNREDENFARFFKLDEVRIITVDGQDVGWIQEQTLEKSIHLGSFYVAPRMQNRGIGTQVLQMLLERAGSESKPLTLEVVKINPALRFYEKRGFRITHEDEHKFYMSTSTLACGPREC